MIQRGGGKKPGRTDPWRSRCILSASIRQLSFHVRGPEVFHGLCQLVRLRNEKGLLPTRHTFPVAGPGPTDRQRLPCEVHSPGLRAPGSALRVRRAPRPRLTREWLCRAARAGGPGARAWAQDERPAVSSLITSEPQIKPLLRA